MSAVVCTTVLTRKRRTYSSLSTGAFKKRFCAREVPYMPSTLQPPMANSIKSSPNTPRVMAMPGPPATLHQASKVGPYAAKTNVIRKNKNCGTWVKRRSVKAPESWPAVSLIS
jgi:hypothetical protein